MYSNFIINTLKGTYSLHLTCCISYCLSVCGLPYSEYYPFSCTAASVWPSVAYHILNTTHSVVQQLLFDPLWPTIFWILPIQLYSSYCLTLCGLPYSEYYPFCCISATVWPSLAYHILNTTRSFVQHLLFAPLWPTIFWILPVQLYSNCCLSTYGLPYTEHCPLSFTYDYYVSVWWPYSSHTYARTLCKVLNFTPMYVHLDCLLFIFFMFPFYGFNTW